MLPFIRMIAILITLVATVVVSLGVFGVFSGDEIKDSLTKVLELGVVTIVAAAIISLIAKK
jgi:hypothetical protein